jgi:hypothetical protein
MPSTFTNTRNCRKACFPGAVLTPFLLIIAGILTVGLLAGCGGGEPEYVEVEEVSVSPQDEAPAHDHSDHAGHDHGAEAGGVGITYEMPDGWLEKAPSSMVLLAFQTGQLPELFADLSVSAFPGDVGGQAANVNRWRRQVGLPPVDPDTALSLISQVPVSGMDGWQVALTGPEGALPGGQAVKMVVTAVSHGGKTWFFKLVGPVPAVDDELENYSAFIGSVTF